MKRTALLLFIVFVILFNSLTMLAGENEWICPKCGKNVSGNYCSNCGEQKPSDEWICSNCRETATGHFCSNCGMAKDTVDNSSSGERQIAAVELDRKYVDDDEYNTIRAYNREGEQIWSYECTTGPAMQTFRVSILEGVNYVYVIETSQYIKLDKQNGKELIKTPVQIGGSPQVCIDSEENVYAVGGLEGKDVFCIEKNGTIKWKCQLDDDFWWPYDLTVSGNTLTIKDESEHNYDSVKIDINTGDIIRYDMCG